MTIADNLIALANQKLGYQDSVEACKVSLENKDVVVPIGAKLADISGLIDEIEQGGGDPSIPVGTGQHLVTFYDFDGKVLKRERVATGGNATAPDTPTHEYLTFAEWNNPFTNVQSDIDTGAIYNTTDGKTYLFITLTPITGLAPTLYFSKSSTSLMTIDWGDGATSTSTTSGNQTIQHTYAAAGDYIITVDNSAGGTWSLGQGSAATAILADGNYSKTLTKIYLGNYFTLLLASLGYNYKSLEYISFGNKQTSLGNASIIASSLKCAIIPKNVNSVDAVFQNNNLLSLVIIGDGALTPVKTFANCISLKSVFCPSSITSVSEFTFSGCISIIQYIFLSPTPPALVSINAFAGINPICKIYVPDASVDAYKTATNWNNYSSYIYPLSQKPQSDE